ncbi:hypothetical protein [Bradyrhizobium sp. AZCC 1620]
MAAVPFCHPFNPHILYERTSRALAPGLLGGGQPETGQQQLALAGIAVQHADPKPSYSQSIRFDVGYLPRYN